MNFKSEIDQAYNDLKMIPINGQDIIVDRILTEFFISNKKNVIISADTGIGKSIIGAVVARVFANRFDWDENEDMCPATIAVHSNSLVKQYRETFNKFGSNMFHQIIGANNYRCPAGEATIPVKSSDQKINAEQCFKSKAEDQIGRAHV